MQNRSADPGMHLAVNSKTEQVSGWNPNEALKNLFPDIFEWIYTNEKYLEVMFYD